MPQATGFNTTVTGPYDTKHRAFLVLALAVWFRNLFPNNRMYMGMRAGLVSMLKFRESYYSRAEEKLNRISEMSVTAQEMKAIVAGKFNSPSKPGTAKHNYSVTSQDQASYLAIELKPDGFRVHFSYNPPKPCTPVAPWLRKIQKAAEKLNAAVREEERQRS